MIRRGASSQNLVPPVSGGGTRFFPEPGRDTRFGLESRVSVSAPLDAVFAFFGNAGNLQHLTPRWLDFRILSPEPIPMRTGVVIDYRIRWHGWPVRWRSKISVWEPPHRFVDVQIDGPYRTWVHEHTFAERAGRTEVVDRVRYDVPGGLLVNRLFVAPDLRRIFAYRRKRLIELLGAGPGAYSSLSFTGSTTSGRSPSVERLRS